MQRKCVLVTGGAGFIGSHLCEQLCSDEQCDVHCLDNLVTGRINNLKFAPRLIFHKLDVSSSMSELRAEFSKIRFDEIYNLACPASPSQYQRDPVFTWKTNVIGTFNLLHLARDHGAKFLQASTSEIYGMCLEHPQRESLWTHLNTVGIRSCYDIGKARPRQ